MVRQQSEELSEPLDENGVADLVQSLVRVQSKTAGRPSTLNVEEETKIYHYVQERAARGIPISKAELIEEVSQFAAKIGAKRKMTLVGSSSGKSVRTTYYVERVSESWFQTYNERMTKLHGVPLALRPPDTRGLMGLVDLAKLRRLLMCFDSCSQARRCGAII
jgi:hypothetical protein